MCNLYTPPSAKQIADAFKVPAPATPYKPFIAPRDNGPFVNGQGECLVGIWGMIPPFAKERTPTARNGRPLSTNNARRETMATAPTFRNAWKKSRRCLIPALSWDEPYWGTGKNVWWRFHRADGQPWALAGLWDEWVDRETGEVLASYTMITQPALSHPVLSQMHRPGKEKRAVVPIERNDWDAWLHGSPEHADQLITLPDPILMLDAPADPTNTTRLSSPLF